MRNFSFLLLAFLLSGCAGLPLPFTEHRLGNFPVETSREQTNVGCLSLEEMEQAVLDLEAQHLEFLRTEDSSKAITKTSFTNFLRGHCLDRVADLSTEEIKVAMFGDLMSIDSAEELRHLGGIRFEYEDVSSRGALEPTIHWKSVQHGPRFKVTGIYRLEDEKVIHFVHSGTIDDAKRKRSWVLGDLFSLLFGVASKAMP